MPTYPPERIFLIGMPGSGKTTVGRALARQLGWEFSDTDTCIQQNTGVDVSTIFAHEGEAGFRRRETEILQRVVEGRFRVVATGGGAVLAEINRECMKAHGAIVFLHTPRDILLRRVRRDLSRPLLQGEDVAAILDAMLDVRMPIYEALCDLCIEPDGRRAKQVATEIIRHYWPLAVIGQVAQPANAKAIER
jgi:shikimate kinase